MNRVETAKLDAATCLRRGFGRGVAALGYGDWPPTFKITNCDLRERTQLALADTFEIPICDLKFGKNA